MKSNKTMEKFPLKYGYFNFITETLKPKIKIISRNTNKNIANFTKCFM